MGILEGRYTSKLPQVESANGSHSNPCELKLAQHSLSMQPKRPKRTKYGDQK